MSTTKPIDPLDLGALLHRAKSGDEDGLNQLCEIVRVRLLGLVRFKVRGWSREEYEDLVQDTLAVFVRDLSKIESNPLIYAHAILQKRIWNEMDKARRRREVSLESQLLADDRRGSSETSNDRVLDENSMDIAGDLERKIKLERVWKAIQSLNHEFCKPLLTALMEGFEIGELWKKFGELDPGLSRNTFDKRVFDCRKRLWAMLGGEL